MPTQREDSEFAEVMKDSVDEVKMSNTSLDNAIDWISSNLNPDEVFNDKALKEWAESNGYTKD
jgi:hypothetical protein